MGTPIFDPGFKLLLTEAFSEKMFKTKVVGNRLTNWTMPFSSTQAVKLKVILR